MINTNKIQHLYSGIGSNLFVAIKKLDIDTLILKTILLFPISTIVQGISIFNPINKILIGILVLMLLFSNIKNINNNLKYFFLKIIMLTISLVGIILTEDFNININNFFYYPLFGLFSLYIAENNKSFKQKITENINFIKLIIYIWSSLVFVSFFIKSSYKFIWDDFYFVSFSNDIPHRFASSCIFILILIFVWIKEEKNKTKFNNIKKYLFCILPSISILLSGARVYLLVLCFILFSIYYNECKTMKIFWISLIPIGIISLVFILISPMGEKIYTVLNNKYSKDILSAFTSGRSEFWIYDLKYFLKSNIYFKLFGNGVSFIFNVNHAAIGMNIYAHNDFINILLSYGYIGLTVYFLIIFNTIKSFFKQEKIKKKLFILTLFGAYFSCAFLNGFYVYLCTLLSFPFLLYCSLDKEEGCYE